MQYLLLYSIHSRQLRNPSKWTSNTLLRVKSLWKYANPTFLRVYFHSDFVAIVLAMFELAEKNIIETAACPLPLHYENYLLLFSRSTRNPILRCSMQIHYNKQQSKQHRARARSMFINDHISHFCKKIMLFRRRRFHVNDCFFAAPHFLIWKTFFLCSKFVCVFKCGCSGRKLVFRSFWSSWECLIIIILITYLECIQFSYANET